MEDPIIIYNIFHEHPFGLPIAIYFYMTGMSAGSFLISTMSYGMGIKKFKPLGKVGVVLATLLLVLAPAFLIIDLGQPLRFWHLFPYLNFKSAITWGSFLLVAYPLNCVIYGINMFKGNDKLTKMFGLIGIPLAISVHGYTGFILALIKARALWNTALMPIYFLVSAMVSGIALMILVVFIQNLIRKDKQLNIDLAADLGKILVITIIFDLFLVLSDVLVLLNSDTEAKEGAAMLLTGNFRPYFLGVEIILGSIIPLVLLLLPFTKRNPITLSFAAVLAMIGVFAMRYVMVIGGMSLPLS